MNETASAADGNCLIERNFDLPFGYRVTFTYHHHFGRLNVCWTPDQPRVHKPHPRRRFIGAYCNAKREFLEEIAVIVGGTILISDTDLKRSADTKSSCRRRGISPF
jgi:hypothetical protein